MAVFFDAVWAGLALSQVRVRVRDILPRDYVSRGDQLQPICVVHRIVFVTIGALVVLAG